MAFTTTHLADLESAIAAGSLEVTFEGKTIKYPSFKDLKERYEFVRSQLIASGDITDSRVRVSVVEYSKD